MGDSEIIHCIYLLTRDLFSVVVEFYLAITREAIFIRYKYLLWPKYIGAADRSFVWISLKRHVCSGDSELDISKYVLNRSRTVLPLN
jgi:hypothetical protein